MLGLINGRLATNSGALVVPLYDLPETQIRTNKRLPMNIVEAYTTNMWNPYMQMKQNESAKH